MEKICKTCRWYVAGSCRLPLYVDGVYYAGRVIEETETCELYEPKEEGNE